MSRSSDEVPFAVSLSLRPGCERSASLRAHAPLLRQIAGRLRQRLPPGVDVDELMQAGLIGLNEALSRYDASRGASFNHFATRRIEGAMLDALRATDELSRDTRARQRQIHDVVRALEHQLLRPPRAQEVAQALGWPVAKLHRCMVDAGAAPLPLSDLSIDSHPSLEGDVLAGKAFDGVADEDSGPEQILLRRQREGLLRAALNALQGRDRLMMDLIYAHGLDHCSTAAMLGVSPGRVSQMHSAVIQALRERLCDS